MYVCMCVCVYADASPSRETPAVAHRGAGTGRSAPGFAPSGEDGEGARRETDISEGPSHPCSADVSGDTGLGELWRVSYMSRAAVTGGLVSVPRA